MGISVLFENRISIASSDGYKRNLDWKWLVAKKERNNGLE
jgi:hypothetical protein